MWTTLLTIVTVVVGILVAIAVVLAEYWRSCWRFVITVKHKTKTYTLVDRDSFTLLNILCQEKFIKCATP